MKRPELAKAERDELRITMWIMGLIVPLVASWFGSEAWLTEMAKWPTNQGRWVEVEGEVAKSLGVAYMGVAIACFCNWGLGYFWYHRLRYLGVILGSVLFFGGIINGIVLMAQ